MIAHILRHTVPAAYDVLHAWPWLNSPAASAMLIAIGLQESGFLVRRQAGGGPARGFWQFERSGIAGVLQHTTTAVPIRDALHALRYGRTIKAVGCHTLVEHHDTLACVFARLLIWTLPGALPTRMEPETAWAQYLEGWRPGRPRPETWDANFTEAWERVEGVTA